MKNVLITRDLEIHFAFYPALGVAFCILTMHHLIFEGAELAGKSWIMSQVYDFLEAKYNKEKLVLDGCHWFNSDVGIFGTANGKFCIEKYAEMLEKLKEKNVIFEKFHISDTVYNRMYRNVEINYEKIEKILQKLDTKIILCKFKEEPELIKKRIDDRLNLYPHYERILQDPEWYIRQQKEYVKEIKKTKLPCLIIDSSELPGNQPQEILEWVGERVQN